MFGNPDIVNKSEITLTDFGNPVYLSFECPEGMTEISFQFNEFSVLFLEGKTIYDPRFAFIKDFALFLEP